MTKKELEHKLTLLGINCSCYSIEKIVDYVWDELICDRKIIMTSEYLKGLVIEQLECAIDDVKNLAGNPTKNKVDAIKEILYQVMRKLSDIYEKNDY